MKYTEQYFRFPIKVYDAASVKKAIADEEATDIPHDGDWVQGFARIPFWELQAMFWYDVFSKGRTVKEVADDGFDATAISHPIFGEFECMWSRAVFEKHLDEFVEKVEKAYAEEQYEEVDEEE